MCPSRCKGYRDTRVTWYPQNYYQRGCNFQGMFPSNWSTGKYCPFLLSGYQPSESAPPSWDGNGKFQQTLSGPLSSKITIKSLTPGPISSCQVSHKTTERNTVGLCVCSDSDLGPLSSVQMDVTGYVGFPGFQRVNFLRP